MTRRKNSEILSAVKSAGEAALRLHEDNKSIRERLRSTQNPGLAVRQQAADEIESLRQQLAESKVILQEAQALRSRLAEAQANEGAWEATAQHHYKEARAFENRLAEADTLLRVARDCLYATSTSPWGDETVARIDAHLARKP